MPEEYPWDEDEVVGLPKDEQPAPHAQEPGGEEPGGEESPPEEPVSPPPSPSRPPERGSAVHFVLPVGPCKGQDRFALVSFVLDGEGDRQQGLVNLHIFGQPGDHPNVTSTHLVRFAQRVPYNQAGEPGTWHWPGEAGEGEGKDEGTGR